MAEGFLRAPAGRTRWVSRVMESREDQTSPLWRVEEIFGWMKTVGGFRKTRFKGRDRTQLAAWWVGAAYNLLRMAKLSPQVATG